MTNTNNCSARAFKLHSESGIPLAIQLMLGQPKQVLARFYFDALYEAWNPDTALSLIEAAARDNELEFDRVQFMQNVAILVSNRSAAGFRDPEIWKECSKLCFPTSEVTS